MNLFEEFQNSFSEEQEVEISLMDYLSLCKKEPLAYATAAERVLSAIGKPKIIDTSKDDRLSRIYMNRTIKVYPAFEQFYGMEEVIERIVGYFVHAAQGLEEKKQILYLLGPVGAAKSSLAEKIKSLVEYHPIYVLKAGDELSPVFETPLGLFDPNKKIGQKIINDFNIPERYLTNLPSPWAVKRLQEFNGDISKFSVVKVCPSKLKQIGIAKTEPGDENNQDISCLVGKVDIRKLEHFSQNDPDAYSYSGALCRGNQGIMEFVEMFKCVEKGTKIALADGTLKNIEDIIVGDTVLAVDEQTLKKTTDIVSKVWETERKEVYQLVTKRGLQLRAAGTHPVLTNHGWKQLQHITKDDFVADLRVSTFGNNTYDYSKLSILAYLLGDGYIKSQNYQFTNDDPLIIEDFIDCVDKLGLGYSTKTKKHQPTVKHLRIKNKIFKRSQQVFLVNEYKNFGIHGLGSADKYIPDFVFGLNKECVSLFLNKLFATDGTITPIKNTNRYSIVYTTKSKLLADQISQLLLKFGIVAKIKGYDSYYKLNDKKIDKGVAYKLHVGNKQSLEIFGNEIGICGRKNIRINSMLSTFNIITKTSGNDHDVVPKNLILENINLSNLPSKRISEKYWLLQKNARTVARSSVQKCTELWQDKELYRLGYSDVYWDAVADINNTGDHAEMYDIQIQKNHNYIANGIVTHNSPIKVLHPLLTATQEGNYTGTEAIGGIPFAGIVLAHSNEAEWQTFRNNKSNEAFLDRICMIKVPYCLRITEEQMIYQKLLQHSSLGNSPCAPKTLEVLSQFCVLTRLKEHENSNLWSKMRVYNGENIKDTDPRAKTIVEYKEVGGVDEGMNGISTRFAFKILSETFNFDNNEVAADPVHLMYVLEQAIKREQFPEEVENKYLEYIKEFIAPKYVEFLEKELQKTYLESYDEYGQNIFDRYCAYADAWISDADYKDQDTGQMLNRELINKELEKIEKPSGISNPKDFRHEFVNYVLRARGKKENAGENPRWTDYEKFRYVIEKKIFSSTEELLPIISFGSKKSSDDMEKHEEFVSRMIKQGYTRAQCRRLVEYYIRQSKSH